MRGVLLALALAACNPDPGYPDQQVTYRAPTDASEADSGERGNVAITEILWSGSVTNDGGWDPTDVFLELRNTGSRPLNLSGWSLEMEGARAITWKIPDGDVILNVGQHRYVAAKTTGCFPEPDWVIPTLNFAYGDPIYVRLVDADEHLMEAAGNRSVEPFAGGYDLKRSRSMERVELMFGGRGTEPHQWHYYTPLTQQQLDEGDYLPNNLGVAENCREATLASPGEANSVDYSGAYASGSLE